MTIKDPYFDTQRGVDRLVEQYQLHKSLIVAFDFDDTVYDYHKKGFEYPEVAGLLLRCQALGFTLIMLTTTESMDYSNARSYCLSLGLKVDWVNQGPVMPRAIKPFFNAYLDDKAGLKQAYDILSGAVKAIELIRFMETQKEE